MVTDAYKARRTEQETPPPRLPWAVICSIVGAAASLAVGYATMTATLATHGVEIVGLRRDIDYDRMDRQQFQSEMRSALGIRAVGR